MQKKKKKKKKKKKRGKFYAILNGSNNKWKLI